MDRKRKALVLFALGVALLFPIFTFAAINPTGAGLVPCGASSNVNVATECEACNLVELVQNIIKFIVGLTISIAAVMFAWAGILYFTSGAKPANIDKGKAIFSSTFFGFILAISAWLIINTLLYTILDTEQFPNSTWFNIECTTQDRPIHKDIRFSDILERVLGIVAVSESRYCPQGETYSASNDKCCPGGLTYNPTRGACWNPNDPTAPTSPATSAIRLPVSVGVGDCSPQAFQADFGVNAPAFSCIARRESSCNAGIGSTVDKGTDGQSVSWGLFQINLSAHRIQCSNINGGQPLNCTSAFTGMYTSTNHNVRVKNQALYEQCVAAATNPQCNKEMARKLLMAAGNKFYPTWGAAAGCGLR